MATSYHYYIVADSSVIPESHELYYSEKVLRLPCYQPNDRKRIVAEGRPSRREGRTPGDRVRLLQPERHAEDHGAHLPALDDHSWGRFPTAWLWLAHGHVPRRTSASANRRAAGHRAGAAGFAAKIGNAITCPLSARRRFSIHFPMALIRPRPTPCGWAWRS